MRDYKHRVIDRRRVREVPPWFWLVAALAGGALIALVVYLASLPRDGTTSGALANAPDTLPPSVATDTTATAEPKPAPDKKSAESKKITATPAPPPTQARFEFFDALPKMKVDVPPSPEPMTPPTKAAPKAEPAKTTASPNESAPAKATKPAPADAASPPLPTSGDRYMLLAGYFRNAREAEQLRNRIAALGYNASVQTVKSGSKEPRYRVRLGPYGHKQADDARNALRANGINAVPLKAND